MKILKLNTLKHISLAAALSLSAVAANAQQFAGPSASSPGMGFNAGAYSFSAPLYIASYGGYGGYTDPTFTVGPNGIQSLGYGYNGYTGMGASYNPDWEMLRSIYAQAYHDGMNSATANKPQTGQDPIDTPDTSNQAGITATPRSAARPVPHGTDNVRAWRPTRGTVALRWQGDPRTVSAVTFEVTDKSGNSIRRTRVSQLPAEVHFTPPANAVFYEAIVQYVDGATNTIMGRLPH